MCNIIFVLWKGNILVLREFVRFIDNCLVLCCMKMRVCWYLEIKSDTSPVINNSSSNHSKNTDFIHHNLCIISPMKYNNIWKKREQKNTIQLFSFHKGLHKKIIDNLCYRKKEMPPPWKQLQIIMPHVHACYCEIWKKKKQLNTAVWVRCAFLRTCPQQLVLSYQVNYDSEMLIRTMQPRYHKSRTVQWTNYIT